MRTKILPIASVVLNSIVSEFPTQGIDQIKEMRNLRLADKEYYKPSSIDLLLGTDIYPLIVSSGPGSSFVGQTMALETIFCYILMRPLRANNSSPSCTFLLYVAPSLDTFV